MNRLLPAAAAVLGLTQYSDDLNTQLPAPISAARSPLYTYRIKNGQAVLGAALGATESVRMSHAGASPGMMLLWTLKAVHLAVIAQLGAPVLVKHCTEAVPPRVAVFWTFAQEPAMNT
jgi:hypothetical protein